MKLSHFDTRLHKDERGSFQKILSKEILDSVPEFGPIAELYSSTSNEFVIRGMHFQHGPKKMSRFIWVSDGLIEDVLVDLRQGETFGHVHSNVLAGEDSKLIFVPWYFAHGFQVMSKKATVNYLTDSDYSPLDESGIKFDSINFEWREPPSHISLRDLSFVNLQNFRGVNVE